MIDKLIFILCMIIFLAGILILKYKYFKGEQAKIEYLKQHGWIIQEVTIDYSGFGSSTTDYECMSPSGGDWLPMEIAYRICKNLTPP